MRFERPEAFPEYRSACKIPPTVRAVKTPTDVIFPWAGSVTLVATLAAATLPTRLEELRFERPEAFPEYRSACKIPPTVREDKTPTDVIFPWAGCETTRATFAAATLPTRFDELRFERPEAFEAMSNPDIVRPVRVPTDVIFPWAGSVTLEATLAAATLPTRLEELRLERPEAFPEYRSACKIPPTVKPVKTPTDVIFPCAPAVTLEATLAAATLPTRLEELRFERPDAFPEYRSACKIPPTVREDKTPTDVILGWAG